MSIQKKSYQANFESIMQAIDGLVYIISAENIIEYVNQKVINVIGKNPFGEKCFKALHNMWGKG